MASSEVINRDESRKNVRQLIMETHLKVCLKRVSIENDNRKPNGKERTLYTSMG